MSVKAREKRRKLEWVSASRAQLHTSESTPWTGAEEEEEEEVEAEEEPLAWPPPPPRWWWRAKEEWP